MTGWPRWWSWLLAFLVAASACAAVVTYNYVDVGPIPSPGGPRATGNHRAPGGHRAQPVELTWPVASAC